MVGKIANSSYLVQYFVLATVNFILTVTVTPKFLAAYLMVLS